MPLVRRAFVALVSVAALAAAVAPSASATSAPIGFETNAPSDVAETRDGAYVLTLDSSNSVVVRKTADLSVVGTVTGFYGTQLLPAADGLVYGVAYDRVYRINPASAAMTTTVMSTVSPQAGTLSADGATLYLANDGDRVFAMDVATGTVTALPPHFQFGANASAAQLWVTPTRVIAAVSGYDSTAGQSYLRLVSVDRVTGALIASLDFGQWLPRVVLLGDHLVIAAGTLTYYDLNLNQTSVDSGHSTYAATATPAGRLYAVTDNAIVGYDSTGAVVDTTLTAADDQIFGLYWGIGSQRLYAWTSDAGQTQYQIQVAQLAGLPATPGSVATAVVGDALRVAFQAGAGPAATSYRVTAHDLSAEAPDVVTTGSASPIDVTGLSLDHTYRITVVGLDDIGEGRDAEPVTVTFRRAQTIDFTFAPSDPQAGGSYALTATGGGSKSKVRFSTGRLTTNSACYVDGTTVYFQHIGTCVVVANQRGSAGEGYAGAPPVSRSVTVGRGHQTIALFDPVPATAPVGATYGIYYFSGGANQPVVASTPSSACRIVDDYVDLQAPGACRLVLTMAGNKDFRAAPKLVSVITITKGN